MLEEWLFTPMPSAMARSSASLLVRPSSLASSWTRIFPATCAFSLSSGSWMSGDGAAPGTAPSSGPVCHVQLSEPECIRSSSPASSTGARSARANARRRTASARQLGERAHSQAPRPGCDRPTTSCPSAVRVTRISSLWTARRRHPTQVRTGSRPGSAVVAGLLQGSARLGSRLAVLRCGRAVGAAVAVPGRGVDRPFPGGDHVALGRVPLELARLLVPNPLPLGVLHLVLGAREDAGLLVGQLGLALDVDPPAGETGRQTGVLAL